MRDEIKDKIQAIETLVGLGYEVRLKKPSVRKTFEVEEDTLAEFIELQEKHEMRMKDAIADALKDWILKKRRS
jgi:hypothetical protein